MPYFSVSGTTANTILAQQVTLDDRTLNRMTTGRGLVPPFRMREVTIRATNKAAKTNISLCFTNDTSFAISGFPRRLHEDPLENSTPSSRPILKAKASVRWASRSGSQRLRQFDWRPPNLPTPTEKDDVVARYPDVSHTVGSATRLAPALDAVHELCSVPGGSGDGVVEWPEDQKSAEPEQPTAVLIHELAATEVGHELSVL